MVAKVSITTDEPPSSIEVRWDDGTTDHIGRKLGLGIKDAFESDLPKGTFEFYHRYQVTFINDPRGGGGGTQRPAPFKYYVLVILKDRNGNIEYRSQQIEIIPKFRLQTTPIKIGMKNSCFGEGSSMEFDILQIIDGDIKKSWPWNPSNDFFFSEPTFLLKGSSIQKDFEITDPLPFNFLSVRYRFIEDDYWFDDKFDLSFFLPLYASGEEEDFYSSKEGSIAGSCSVMYVFDYQVKLLVPLPSNSRVVGT